MAAGPGPAERRGDPAPGDAWRCATSGIDEVRFTGGEPLLRKDLPALVAGTSALRTPDGRRVRTALTTNGVGLDRRAASLAEAGLDRVTISLDSLRQDRYLTITHRDRLHDVLAGIDAALAHGLGPVKVNALVVRGVNEDEPVELVRWACTTGVELRIIEHMPLDAQGAWDRGGHGHRRGGAGPARHRLRPRAGRGPRQRPGRALVRERGRRAHRHRRASSPRSPGRSAAAATGCG